MIAAGCTGDDDGSGAAGTDAEASSSDGAAETTGTTTPDTFDTDEPGDGSTSSPDPSTTAAGSTLRAVVTRYNSFPGSAWAARTIICNPNASARGHRNLNQSLAHASG